MMTRDEMIEILKNKVVAVKFTKNDGSERVMNATLLNEYVEPHIKSTSGTKRINQDVIAVIDTDLNEWRSFRVDSVKSFE